MFQYLAPLGKMAALKSIMSVVGISRDLALERGEDPKLVHVGPITNHAHD